MVRVTAAAVAGQATEPARAHAVDLVLLGHLLAAQLAREGVCTPGTAALFPRGTELSPVAVRLDPHVSCVQLYQAAICKAFLSVSHARTSCISTVRKR